MTEEHFTEEVEKEPDYKDKYLRSLAEADNARKRLQKEKQEMTRFALDNLLAEILIPVDSLETALKCTENLSPELRNWAQGFQMILGQFKDVLSNHGVAPFHSEGTSFDPHLHDAIEVEETTEYPDGTIISEFVKGYKSGDRTLRPARVKVAKTPHSLETTNQEQSHDSV